MAPDEFTLSESMLDVGDGHKLYVQDWGNSKAENPIIFLHGGPGGGINDGHKGFFEPAKQRVIFFDQRGSGKSTPHGSLNNNTTQDLISDINKIASHFRMGKFILVGGSWGSCLALAYALAYPEKVLAMVLRGIFTASQDEIDWAYKGLFKTHFPEAWENYLASTPAKFRADPSDYHIARILGNDASAARESAWILGNLEGATGRLDDRFRPKIFDETYDPTFTKIETHYLAQGCFLPNNYILDNASQLKMPIYLVQGRYDFVCPPMTAYALAQKLPASHLIWTQAGHSGSDRENWLATKTILENIS